MSDHRSITAVAERINAREEGHIPAPLAHRPPLQARACAGGASILLHERDTDRDGEWLDADTLVEVRR